MFSSKSVGFPFAFTQSWLPPTPPEESMLSRPPSGNGAGATPHTDDGESEKRIQALEQEAATLTTQASAAADKVTDYENQLRIMNEANNARFTNRKPVGSGDNSLQINTSPSTTDPRPESSHSARTSSKDLPTLPDRPSSNSSMSALPSSSTYSNSPITAATQPTPLSARPSLFSGLARSFSRRGSPATPTAPRQPPIPSIPTGLQNTSSSPSPSSSVLFPAPAPSENIAVLESQLQNEQAQRRAAETRLREVNSELEDLSATLFSQANEMVAAERRARAEGEKAWGQKLAEQEARSEARARESEERNRIQEDKIKRLEDKVRTLELREKERNARLEKLERAMQRAGRLRAVLDRPAG